MEKLLILGGTSFIGRRLTESLLETNQYELTIFNRGVTNAALFDGVTKISGDRNTDDIEQIFDQHWDYIIDVSCYMPDSLEQIVKGLQKSPQKYIFISTCSVYQHTESDYISKEEIPVRSCTPEQRVEKTLKAYGEKKAECERILTASGFDHVILRPTLVFGQYDPTDRLYYWLYQVRENDPLLLPEDGARQLSLTYVNDLVQGAINSLRIDTPHRVFNAVSYPVTSIGEIVAIAAELLGKRPRTINAAADFLQTNDIKQWMGMPLWINGDYFTYNNDRFVQELAIEPISLRESIRETIAYYEALEWPVPQYGLSEEERLGLLQQLS